MDGPLPFRQVWLVDTEFRAPDGEPPEPICLCAREFFSGRAERLWLWGAPCPAAPPFCIGTDSLFVAYYASAELGVFQAFGWPMPARILDLYAEFRCLTSGRPAPCGNSLLGALAAFGLPCMDALAKEDMRRLAMRGGSFNGHEARELVDYCQEDADALAPLLAAMLPYLDLPRALLRGRYLAAVARMEAAGVHLDTEALDTLRDRWEAVQDRLIARIDADFGVFDGRHFCEASFQRYLARHDIPWPRLASGALQLSGDSFEEMTVSYPALKPLHDLRVTLAQLKEWKLAVGGDGRNRVLLSPFASKTGRNQPSTAKYIFGPAVWLRSLIKPDPGMAIAYVDWEQQEFGIGAALAGDLAMQAAYRSGDPYLTFAQQAGAVPPNATKATHKAERELFKLCALGVQYGMGAESLARRIGKQLAAGRELLELHKGTYPAYWRWSDAVQDCAMLRGYLDTVFGWRVHVGTDANPRSLRNFPLQGNGAEMLRVACCLATERSIRVCAPVHDALLVEGPAREIESVVEATQEAMREASELVLPGFPLRTEAKLTRWPDRYRDDRGERMWRLVWESIGTAQSEERTCCAGATGRAEPTCCAGVTRPVAPAHTRPLLFSLFSDPL
jgi:hypothetical protein